MHERGDSAAYTYITYINALYFSAYDKNRVYHNRLYAKDEWGTEQPEIIGNLLIKYDGKYYTGFKILKGFATDNIRFMGRWSNSPLLRVRSDDPKFESATALS